MSKGYENNVQWLKKQHMHSGIAIQRKAKNGCDGQVSNSDGSNIFGSIVYTKIHTCTHTNLHGILLNTKIHTLLDTPNWWPAQYKTVIKCKTSYPP